MLNITEDHVEQIRARLQEAMRWAGTEVPKTGIIHHLGISTRVGDLGLGFSPRDSSSAVVTMYLRYGDRPAAQQSDRPLGPPLTEEEVAALRSTLPSEPVDEWNGAGCHGVSFAVSCRWHPTLYAAHTVNYDSCPAQKPKCTSPVFCGCEERRACYDQVPNPWLD